MAHKQRTALDEFEETAVMGAKAVREFLTYQGSNKSYFDKAKVGATSMSGYARLRATMANEAALRLAANRGGPNVLALVDGEKAS